MKGYIEEGYLDGNSLPHYSSACHIGTTEGIEQRSIYRYTYNVR
jgi:hypothetical protein